MYKADGDKITYETEESFKNILVTPREAPEIFEKSTIYGKN